MLEDAVSQHLSLCACVCHTTVWYYWKQEEDLISHIFSTCASSCLRNNWNSWDIELSGSWAQICQQAAPSDNKCGEKHTHVCVGWQRMLLKQQLSRETIWGSCCWPPTPPWSHASITCSRRNPWWVSVGNTRQRHKGTRQPNEPQPSQTHLYFYLWKDFRRHTTFPSSSPSQQNARP